MSEKEHTVPGEALRDGPAGEENTGAPIETQPESSGGERENGQSVSRETSKPDASPAQARNKRSSFYVYLAVLFGAAFLMLLLAYFVQRRNNETAQSDLRSSFSATRQELMEEIEGLEEEKQKLLTEKEALQAQVDKLQQLLDEQTDQNFWRERELEDLVLSWQAIQGLERDFRTGDYDGCVTFFESACISSHYFTPPEAADGVEEIYHELAKKGILNEEDYPLSTILGRPATNQQQ